MYSNRTHSMNDLLRFQTWAASRNWCMEIWFSVDAQNTVEVDMALFEKFVTHRVWPKFSIFWIKLYRCPVLYFFDRIPKYLFIIKLSVFKARKYLLPRAVTSSVSIGNPMGNVSSDSALYWVSYRNWPVTVRGSTYFRTLKSHNFLMRKYIFLDRSKIE